MNKLIIIVILFIVAGCTIGGHKWNPTFSIIKMLDKGNKNQLGTRG